MLHATLLRDGDDRRHPHRVPARLLLAEPAASTVTLARYIEGWAEADPAKIAEATAEDYNFLDPLVGRFSRRTLPQYFALLRSRFATVGVAEIRDLVFMLRGPMMGASHAPRRQYWREAPLLGLTGFADITVRRGWVVAEEVAYDLNMACETLRGGSPNESAPTQQEGNRPQRHRVPTIGRMLEYVTSKPPVL
jgi:hypothetical protein